MIDRKKLKGRRILAILLSLSLIAGNTPALATAVYAETAEPVVQQQTAEEGTPAPAAEEIEPADVIDGEVAESEAHVATVTAGDTIKYFSTLETALVYANTAGNATVVLKSSKKVMLKDETATVGPNVTLEIASGTTLLLPYKKADGTDSSSFDGDGGSADIASWNNPSVDLLDHSLFVDGKVIIKGSLEVAGVTGYSRNVAYQGMTCGRYSEMVVSGTGSVDVYGTMFVNGHVRGAGSVEVMSGGILYEPLIFLDSPGGSILEMVYETEFPITRYALNSIVCKTEINYGATVWGRGKLYGEIQGIPQFVSNNMKIVASSGALVNLKTGSKAIVTTDTSKVVDHDIYVKTCSVTNGVSIGAIGISALGYEVSSKNKYLPVPYNFHLELKDGNYDISDGVYAKLMPGTEIVVGEGATLNIGSNGKLLVYDGLMLGDPTASDIEFPDRLYPRAAELQEKGLSAAGQLILDGGTLNLKDGSSFAGLVQNTGRGTVIVEEGASLGTPEGYIDGYSTSRGSNDTKLTVDAKIWNGLEYTKLQAGKTYTAYAGTADVKTYEMAGFHTEYWKERSVPQYPQNSWIAYPKTESRQGTWNLYDINVAENDSCKSIKVETSNEELFNKGVVEAGSDITITVTLHDGITGENGGAPVVNGAVLDEEQSGNGVYVYTISNVSSNVNIAVTGTKDTVAPTGKITVGSHSWDTYNEDAECKAFFNTKEDVTITASDIGNGIAEVAYTTSKNRILKQIIELDSSIQWTQLDAAGGEWTFNFNDIASIKDKTEVTENIFVFVRIKDKAGNVTYISSEGMALDTVKPAVTVNTAAIAEGAVYYNTTDSNLTVRIADTNLDYVQVNGGEKQYGVKSVELDAQNDMNSAYTITAVDKAGNRYTTPAFHYVNLCTVKFIDKDGKTLASRTYEYGQTPQVPAVVETYVDETTQTEYQFSGWSWTDAEGDHVSKTIPAVSGSVTYTAQYEATGYRVTVPAAADGRYEVTDNGNGYIGVGGTYTFTIAEAIEGSVCYFDVTAADLDGNAIEMTEENGTYTIADQGKAVVVTVEAVKHDEKTTTVDATCKAPGSVTTTCTNELPDGSTCKWGSQTELPQLAHDTEETITPATCISSGYAKGVCKLCNEEVTGEVLPQLPHNYVKVDSKSTEPTCHSAGLYVFECTTCAAAGAETPASYQVEQPATGAHALVKHAAKAPTCTAEGHNEYYTCGNEGCGYSTKEVITATGHSFSEAVTNASCTVDGYITKTCGSCGNTEIEYPEHLKAIGHVKVIDEAVEATCTSTGLTEGAHCQNCSYVYSAQKEVPVKSHTYVVSVKEATCTEDGLKTSICSVCGDTVKETLTAPGHKYVNWRETKAATCTEPGVETGTCACGETDTKVIDALGHKGVNSSEMDPVNDFTAAVPATCTTDGNVAYYTCDRCKVKFEDVEGTKVVENIIIEATGHDWSEWKTTSAPGCTKNGEEERVCKNNASHKETNVLEALGHDYDEGTVKAASCEKDGYTKYTCQRDGCGYFELETITKKGHDFKPVYNKDTKQHQNVCQRDGCKATEPAVACTFDAGVVTKASTCSEVGEMTYTCTVCEGQYTAEVAKLPHTPVVLEAVEATCIATGLTEGSKCSVCDATIVAQTVVAVKPHEFGEWTRHTDPTCTEKGKDERKCLNCTIGFDYRDVTALGHTEVIDSAVAATCTTTGKTEGKHCSVCSTVLIAQTVVEALGHTPVIDEAVAATCTETGLTEGSHCGVCGETIVAQEVVEAKGHSFTKYISNNDATCTKDGTETAKCDNCDVTDTRTIADSALGHDIVTDKAVEPTCTETGLTEGQHCTRCDDKTVKQEVVNALGHDEVVDRAVAATCTETGLTKGSHCTRCDYKVAQKVVPALDHDKISYEGQPATCLKAGWKAYETCSRCEEYNTYERIPALGHDIVTDKAVPPTCTETGLTEGQHCTRCDDKTVAQEVVAATGHTEAKIPAVAATCTKAGSTEGTKCSVCDEILKAPETVAALGHKYDNGVVTKEPTVEEKGIKTFSCEICKDSYTEDIPKLEKPDEPEDPVEPEDPDTPVVKEGVTRIFGSNRFETAIKSADALKAELNVAKFDTIIVANGMTFADALPGSYLAAEKDAPILLIDGPRAAMVREYISKNLKSGGTVYVLGGENAVNTAWLDGIKFKRLGGKNRYDTNLLILKEAGVASGEQIMVCTGNNFADSLSVSATGKPILMVGTALNADQKAYLETVKKESYCVIGGTGAVSSAVEAEFKQLGKTKRVAGTNRYTTSVAVAEEFFENPEQAVLAYAMGFPDGLSGGPVAYNLDAPLILTQTGKEDIAAEYTAAKGIKSGYVLGGSGLISDDAIKTIFKMGKGDEIVVK